MFYLKSYFSRVFIITILFAPTIAVGNSQERFYFLLIADETAELNGRVVCQTELFRSLICDYLYVRLMGSLTFNAKLFIKTHHL